MVDANTGLTESRTLDQVSGLMLGSCWRQTQSASPFAGIARFEIDAQSDIA